MIQESGFFLLSAESTPFANAVLEIFDTFCRGFQSRRLTTKVHPDLKGGESGGWAQGGDSLIWRGKDEIMRKQKQIESSFFFFFW